MLENTNIPTSIQLVALAFHYAQLEASAFREEFNPETFEDPTKPNIDMIHKVCPLCVIQLSQRLSWYCDG